MAEKRACWTIVSRSVFPWNTCILKIKLYSSDDLKNLTRNLFNVRTLGLLQSIIHQHAKNNVSKRGRKIGNLVTCSFDIQLGNNIMQEPLFYTKPGAQRDRLVRDTSDLFLEYNFVFKRY